MRGQRRKNSSTGTETGGEGRLVNLKLRENSLHSKYKDSISKYPKIMYNIHPVNHRQAFPALISDSLLDPGPTDDPIRVEAFKSTFFLSPLPFSGTTFALLLSPKTFALEAADSFSL
jgi:hypothetical protein